uniref:Hemolysin-type calcium-binding region C-terminal end protein n=1 Tax=uncultured microorganism TaxID=358574 RepID=F8UHN7_9ZZZZ|nr:hemolysin-type calcium-binding region C-terminal end protein [uncultured microorganism]
MARTYGADTVQDTDLTAGNVDALEFLTNISSQQLWFRKANQDLDLEVDIIGTTDKVTITNWFAHASKYHVEQFKTSDGKMLLDTKVQALVVAMSTFDPPATGTLPAGYANNVSDLIASSWQPQ